MGIFWNDFSFLLGVMVLDCVYGFEMCESVKLMFLSFR